MTRYGPPVLYALFVWWFATGLALYLVRLRPWTFHWSLLGATALLVASLWGLAVSAADTSVTGAYVAFTCTVLVWGWQEIGFLTGLVTGPWRQPCPDHCSTGQRAGYAVAAILYHELALVALGVAVVAATWGGANQTGTWTFAILWAMRLSTKLNLFLGVPILHDELLPGHLRYLGSFFARKAMSLLFPVSVTVSTVLLVVLLQWASALDAPERAVGYTLLATLTALAILEHWFMALPLPVAALWSWSLRAGAAGACPGEVDPVRRSRTCANNESASLPGSRRRSEWFTMTGKRPRAPAVVPASLSDAGPGHESHDRSVAPMPEHRCHLATAPADDMVLPTLATQWSRR